MKSALFPLLTVSAVLLLLATPAEAGLVTDDTGFFDSPNLVDFDTGFPIGVPIESITIGDATFSAPNFPDSAILVVDDSAGSSAGTFDSSFPFLEVTGTIRVDFASTINRVGFNYESTTSVFLEAYDAGGNLLNAGDTGGITSPDGAFMGVESATAISHVIIHDSNLTFFIDDFRYELGLSGGGASVPEPASWLLVSGGLGFLGLVFATRRKKAAA